MKQTRRSSVDLFKFLFQMKNFSSLFSLLGAAVFAMGLISEAHATIWTVSNDANRPAQFTTLQEAHDAASIGDTILITGNNAYNAEYAGINVYKPLTFIGEGIDDTSGPATRIGSMTFRRLNNALGSSGSRMYGCDVYYITIEPDFSGSAAGEEVLSDFIFERLEIYYMSLNSSSGEQINDVTVRNCVFESYGGMSAQGSGALSLTSNVILSNNVFSNFTINSGGEVNNTWLLQNNLFLNKTSDVFSQYCSELVIENNIFYKAEPTGASNSIFNNNLTFLCNNGTLPYGSNVGSGNIDGENPLFVNYPELGGVVHSFAHDYSLQSGSPAAGTGTNGSDIGLNGGNAPVANIPQYAAIPAVTLLDIPVSSVPVGGTLQVNIEAISRN